MTFIKFKKLVWKYYRTHGRKFPWRETRDPYKILVSEVMLQQTQTHRVEPKYKEFIAAFPTVEHLARASVREVILTWQGLGYNRRAVNLKRAAERIMKDFGGKFPKDYAALISLPAIGPATAGDILAFAWDIAVPLIETNIRTVYIHHFFPSKEKVSDKDILPLVEKTLDRKNPRDWYYALMDYGAELKRTVKNNSKSRHYAKQSPFKGSNRELRSRIVKYLLKEQKPMSAAQIGAALQIPSSILLKNLTSMHKEHLLHKSIRGYAII